MASLSRGGLSRKRKTSYWAKATFFIVGSIAITAFLVLHGIPTLVRLALLLESTSPPAQTSPPLKTPRTRPTSPILYPPPLATNTAVLAVRGLSEPRQQVRIYLNGVAVANVLANSSGEFSYSNLVLNPGENQLLTASVNPQGEEVTQSPSYSITYRNEPPEINIIEPEDNTSFFKGDNPITIKGETDSDNSVQINGHLVIVHPDGQFSYSLHLNDGENSIKILAKDPAGNITEKKMTVFYSQEE